MPSSITHNYFMQDVYDKLDDNIENKINLESAKVFAQGPDIFYFYNLCFGRKSKKYRKAGNYIHKHKVNLYFKNIINYIIENDLIDDIDCISFLYGSICHYVLDSVVHPFVYYNTGVFKKSIPMIFQNEKVEAKDFKMYKYILKKVIIKEEVLNLIDNVISNTYNYDNMGKIYNKCIKDMRLFFKLFNYDHYGVKKILYSFIDLITPKRFILKKKFSFYLKHSSKKYYLNLEKSEWNHPCNLYEKYNYSFIELYIIAIDKACHIIQEVDKMIKSKNCDSEEIDLLFKNLSYITGKNCDSGLEMKYFEF